MTNQTGRPTPLALPRHKCRILSFTLNLKARKKRGGKEDIFFLFLEPAAFMGLEVDYN